MNDHGHLTRLVLLCGQCNCGCPEVLIDNSASADQRVVIADDFGQQVRMSVDQFQVLVEEARAGHLDERLAALSVT
jgi:hypothetical protein